MEYKATAKYMRVSMRKMRLIADAVRHLPLHRALTQLTLMKKRGGSMLQEVFRSAISNAKGKNVNEDALEIKAVDIMEGPRMKRWHAAPRGMAHPYKKRMTHIRVVLTDDLKKKTKDIHGGNKTR